MKRHDDERYERYDESKGVYDVEGRKWMTFFLDWKRLEDQCTMGVCVCCGGLRSIVGQAFDGG